MIDITPNQNGGVLKRIDKQGVGDTFPLPGSMVKINFSEHLRDGTLLQTTFGTDYQHEIEIGRDTQIIAWDIGIPTMKKGEEAIFFCDAEYSIKKISDVECTRVNRIYIIELLSWKGNDISPTCDGEIIRYHTLVVGKGAANLKVDDMVEVKLVGRYEERIFDERDVQFIMKESNKANVIYGIELALVEFNIGETSRLKIKPEYAFGTLGCRRWEVPPNATVDYTVTLKSVKEYKDSPAQSRQERIQQVSLYEEYATWYLKKSIDSRALEYFNKMCKLLHLDKDIQDDLKKERIDLLLKAYLNISEISLRLKDYLGTQHAASQVLKIDPDNLKALNQRGRAYSALNKKELAEADFKHYLEKHPTNEEVRLALDSCSKKGKKRKT